MHIKKEHIQTHFVINRTWKALFLKYFPEWTAETWAEDVWSIFENNGYRYEIERYSNNPDSKLYCAVRCVDLFGPDKSECSDGFVVGYGDSNISSAVEQMLINVICNFDVDFTKFN